MSRFDHRDPGTPESVWETSGSLERSEEFALDFDHLIVVSAHPDDETLGAGGLITRAHDLRRRITVIVATDGENSHPDSPTVSPAEMRRLRRGELTSAMRTMAPAAELHFLGYPDGALRENAQSLKEDLERIVTPLASIAGETRLLILSPWSGDGHRDHRVAAEAVAVVCRRHRLEHWGYPVWLWHWGTPEDVPWPVARVLRLTSEEVAIKRQAIAAHISQLHPLSSAPGDEPIVHPEMRRRFERATELYLRERVSPDESIEKEWFDGFYSRHDDPWGFDSRWYEERKRNLILACLPHRSLGQVLEIGSATGHVTRELAARSDHVTAIDPAGAALEVARDRLPPNSPVTFVQGQVPDAWPYGRYDTIVLSEVGYYLSRADLARTVELIAGSLESGGTLVACHWRHPVPEYPLTGDEVHEALHGQVAWERTVHHVEKDFLLDVFSPRPALSVAQREGLV